MCMISVDGPLFRVLPCGWVGAPDEGHGPEFGGGRFVHEGTQLLRFVSVGCAPDASFAGRFPGDGGAFGVVVPVSEERSVAEILDTVFAVEGVPEVYDDESPSDVGHGVVG